MDTDPHQKGASLIEVMVAMTVALVLSTAVTAIFMSTLRIADDMKATVFMNQDAREMFDLLALGGGIDRTDYVRGLRAISDDSVTIVNADNNPVEDGAGNALLGTPDGVDSHVLQYQVNDWGAALGGRILESRRISQTVVTCVAADDPVEGCTVGATVTVVGTLRRDPDIGELFTDGNQRTRSVTLHLADPTMLNRTDVAVADRRSVYWNGFLMQEGR